MSPTCFHLIVTQTSRTAHRNKQRAGHRLIEPPQTSRAANVDSNAHDGACFQAVNALISETQPLSVRSPAHLTRNGETERASSVNSEGPDQRKRYTSFFIQGFPGLSTSWFASSDVGNSSTDVADSTSNSMKPPWVDMNSTTVRSTLSLGTLTRRCPHLQVIET